jgi:hypothetical protein
MCFVVKAGLNVLVHQCNACEWLQRFFVLHATVLNSTRKLLMHAQVRRVVPAVDIYPSCWPSWHQAVSVACRTSMGSLAGADTWGKRGHGTMFGRIDRCRQAYASEANETCATHHLHMDAQIHPYGCKATFIYVMNT